MYSSVWLNRIAARLVGAIGATLADAVCNRHIIGGTESFCRSYVSKIVMIPRRENAASERDRGPWYNRCYSMNRLRVRARGISTEMLCLTSN